MDLITKLKTLMIKNKIKNTSQLSKETNIPYTTLKSIFDGDVNDIRLSTSRKLCDYFHITLDELLDDDIELNDGLSDDFNTDGLTDEEIAEVNRYIEFIKNKKKEKEI